MGKLILDAELRKKLNDGRTPLEVCDEAGNVIGHYLPEEELQRRLAYAEAKALLSGVDNSAARKEAIENGFQGYTTAEVLARLAEARREWEARRK